MSKIVYGCGHQSGKVIFDFDKEILKEWIKWRDSVGYMGNQSKCWRCYYEKV